MKTPTLKILVRLTFLVLSIFTGCASQAEVKSLTSTATFQLPSPTLKPTSTATTTPTATVTQVPTQMPPDNFEVVATLIPEANNPGWVNNLAFSSDGSLLAVGYTQGASDNIVRIYDMATMCQKFQLVSNTNINFGIAFSPDDRYVATSFYGQTGTQLWDLKDELLVEKIETQMSESPDGIFSPRDITGPIDLEFFDGSDALFYRGSRAIEFMDLRDGQLIQKVDADYYYEHADLSPSGEFFAASSRNDNDIWLWKATNRALLLHLDQPDGDDYQNSNLVQFSPDGNMLAYTYKSELNLLDISTQQTVSKLNAERDVERFGGLAFSADSKYVIGATYITGAGQSGNIYIWNTQTNELVGKYSRNPLNATSAIAISPDGQYIAIGTFSGKVLLLGNPEIAASPSLGCPPLRQISKAETPLPSTQLFADFQETDQLDLLRVDTIAADQFSVKTNGNALQISPNAQKTDFDLNIPFDWIVSPGEQALVQADLQLTPESNGFGLVYVRLSGAADNRSFFAQCYLTSTPGGFGSPSCYVFDDVKGEIVFETGRWALGSNPFSARANTYYTFKILLLTNENRVEFYLGDDFLGQYRIPGERINFTHLQPSVGTWTAEGKIFALIDNIYVSAE